MIPNNRIVLAIAPYSKGIGVAVFAVDNLIFFDLKSITSPRTNVKIELKIKKIFQEEVKWYQPDLVVVKDRQTAKGISTHSDIAFTSVLRETTQENLRLKIVSLQDAKRFLCSDKKVNEINVLKVLCKRYPELTRFRNLPTKDQKDYYRPLIGAVTLGFYQVSKNTNDKAKQ